jgi:hypothetical protein
MSCIAEMALVNDQGMISQKHIEELKGQAGTNQITAFKSGALRKLVSGERHQPGLLDECIILLNLPIRMDGINIISASLTRGQIKSRDAELAFNDFS